MPDDETSPSDTRKRVPAACEACRATKIRCRPSERPGICQKCLASKIECVSRAGPRVRRSRKAKLAQESESLSSASPQMSLSSTFSIDFALPERCEVDGNFETLRHTHETAVDKFLPSLSDASAASEKPQPAPSCPVPASSPSSYSQSQQLLHDSQGRPSFNLASAECLLASFRSMLEFFPCIALAPDDFSVTRLTARQPFVLLAILAAASGSKTLQGHTLYDDEFRKVLGLKYVAAGERSLELLQGILVYCAWYPFHLRPQNKQAFNYLNMASDLINELGLDQPNDALEQQPASELSDEQLQGIRAYLGYSYIVSTFFGAWKGRGGITCHYTPWTETCCGILRRSNSFPSDLVLITLVQLAYTLHDASEAIHERSELSMQDRQLLLSGLLDRYRELQANMPSFVASIPSVKTLVILLDVYFEGGPLQKLPRATRTTSSMPARAGAVPLASFRLYLSIPPLKLLLETLAGFDEATYMCFTLHDWARLIITTIFSLRLSFAIADCPDYDAAWARSQLCFGDFLCHMARETDLTPASRKVDVLSASRVVLRLVKDKYESCLREVQTTFGYTQAPIPRQPRCPMLDSTLNPYLTLWDQDTYGAQLLQDPLVDSLPDEAGRVDPEFNELWTSLAMDWVNDQGQVRTPGS